MTTATSPSVSLVHIPYPDGVPSALDQPLLGMFRCLDRDTRSKLGALDPDERSGLLFALTSTLMRALYHQSRFGHLVEAAQSRHDAFEGRVMFDSIGKFVLFEALSLLMATRTVVDQVFYIAGRRRGCSESDSDALTPNAALNVKNSQAYALDEAAILRGDLRDWYEELNAYRNVVGHQGWRELNHTFFPRDDLRAEALDPTRNVMLVPDRGSMKARNRHLAWTYAERVRLEDLVERIGAGLLRFAEQVGVLWGGSIPSAGSAVGPPPNMLVEGKWALDHSNEDGRVVALRKIGP